MVSFEISDISFDKNIPGFVYIHSHTLNHLYAHKTYKLHSNSYISYDLLYEGKYKIPFYPISDDIYRLTDEEYTDPNFIQSLLVVGLVNDVNEKR